MGFLKELIIATRLKNNETGGRNFLPWDKIKTVALVIDSKTLQSKNVIDNFIYQSGKVIDVYCLDIDKKESSIKNFITFTKTEKSLWGLPNGKARAKIAPKKYDVLVNASFAELDYSAVISHHIKAICKCGYQSRSSELDLIVSRKDGQVMEKYLEDLVNYLKMIRN